MARDRRFGRHPWAPPALVVALAAASAWRSTDPRDPPRFDGAGYAVLARSLAEGEGYRGIDHPEAPRHAHFPPGYPLALAALWRATGGASTASAHALSVACTAGAALAAWRWFRVLYPPRTALALGLALAVNWTWARTGGAIQSEPLFLLLGGLALLAAVRAGRRGGVANGLVLGALLAACALTRHVGVALGSACGVDLLLRRRVSAAAAAGSAFLGLTAPWVAWVAAVPSPNQAGLLAVDRGTFAGRVAGLALFYVQRIPDQWTGPFVEVGTVFQGRPAVALAVNAWAFLATGLIGLGWARTLRTPRRRLAGLSALSTLALLLVWPFTEAGRFLIPLVPALLAGAVEGLGAVAALAGVRRARRLASVLVLAASIPYAAYALAGDRAGALRRTHAGFDDACAWVAREAERPGPVLTRHPGEVFWQTGRKALAPDGPGDVGRAIDRYGVAYLLVDDERYANAPANPLSAFVASSPDRVREVWAREAGRSSVRVYEVVNGGEGRRPPGPRT